MKQEDKELLLQDLCSRLSYKVKCSFGVDDAVYEITGINPTCCGASEIQATHIESGINGDFRINSCNPYLFPLSSMTEEQKNQLKEIWDADMNKALDYAISGKEGLSDLFQLSAAAKIINWFIENHFDYRGLIPKGLAIDCANLNIY